MLKSLLNKVKSQRAGSRVEEEPRQQQHQSLPPELWNHSLVHIPEPVVVGPVPTVRYSVVHGMPDLIIAIESCALPFHELPFSKRKVKEVDLDKLDRLPSYLQFLLKVFSKYLSSPNHFLINDYPSGVGILPHLDGPMYDPHVLVYSIGTAVIEFISKDDHQNKHKLLLEDRSLHLFEEKAYTEYLHGIHDYGVDCIFIKFDFGLDGRIAGLSNCSVVNFAQTHIFQEIKSRLSQGTPELAIDKYQLSAIVGNPEYNYKLEMDRSRRISITIRHKYPQT